MTEVTSPNSDFEPDVAGALASDIEAANSPLQPSQIGRELTIHHRKGPTRMTDDRTRIYDLYLAAWSDIPHPERDRMLHESLSDTIVFTNPLQTRRGLADVAEHLAGFQRRSPGGSFRMNNMVGWEDHALAEWQLVDGRGEPGVSGYDVLKFDEHGRISTILLFGNVEAQKLAWRRRDAVSLDVTP